MSASASETKPLPPDPDGLNDKRADWAYTGLRAFQRITGSDDEDMVSDMLADIRHWCDRNGQDFERELARGWEAYEEETKG